MTGNYKFTLDELQDVSIEQNQETTDITGRRGRKLNTLKRNKTIAVNGTNGLISSGLLEMQTGGSFTSKTTVVMWTDYITAKVENLTLTTDEGEELTTDDDEEIIVMVSSATSEYAAYGTTGNEIKSLFVKNEDGTLGMELTQGSVTNEGVFTYDPETRIFHFHNGDLENGDELVAHYYRQIQADVLDNTSDTFSGKCQLYIDAIAEDKCSNIYRVQFYIPKAIFSGEFTFELGGDQTVHEFECEAFAGACGANQLYFTYTVFGIDD